MYRKEIIELLKKESQTAADLATRFECKPKGIQAELAHIRKSLKREGLALKVTPARCRKCGFTFDREKVVKPGKCPRCRSTWIREPEFRIE